MSTSVRALNAANLIYRKPLTGDRRKHVLAGTDLWEIAAGQGHREPDPPVTPLATCAAEAGKGATPSRIVRRRLATRSDVTQTIDLCYARTAVLPRAERASSSHSAPRSHALF
ncbi:MAG: hypothetical protein AAF317_08170, partial [Pseudomonadota bacterium]